MTRNRARKIDTRRHAAETGLTHAQAAQELTARSPRRPEIPEGIGFVLDVWDGSQKDQDAYPEPHCMGCARELPVGEASIVLPEVRRHPERRSPWGLCPDCLPGLAGALALAEQILRRP
ncbi:hypothetical protein ABZW10_33070 [Kitasatospora sp. NPDC004723]|uniref:hypothetical protein n=1 Tax=Kitasatospora sp. NPDC004723 TaxID=3154288 RepID=UPI0033A5DAFB